MRAYAPYGHTCASLCLRARLCVLRPMCIGAEPCEHVPPAVDRVRLGSQAFASSSSFSANIGAWNTASLTSLYQVCAAFGRRRTTAAGALGRGSVRRGTCGDGTADARAHTCVRAYTYSLAADVDGCTPSCAQGRWNAAIYI